MTNHKILNKKTKDVKSEKIEVKTRFCDKDLSSLDSRKIKRPHKRENTWMTVEHI